MPAGGVRGSGPVQRSSASVHRKSAVVAPTLDEHPARYALFALVGITGERRHGDVS